MIFKLLTLSMFSEKQKVQTSPARVVGGIVTQGTFIAFVIDYNTILRAKYSAQVRVKNIIILANTGSIVW